MLHTTLRKEKKAHKTETIWNVLEKVIQKLEGQGGQCSFMRASLKNLSAHSCLHFKGNGPSPHAGHAKPWPSPQHCLLFPLLPLCEYSLRRAGKLQCAYWTWLSELHWRVEACAQHTKTQHTDNGTHDDRGTAGMLRQGFGKNYQLSASSTSLTSSELTLSLCFARPCLPAGLASLSGDFWSSLLPSIHTPRPSPHSCLWTFLTYLHMVLFCSAAQRITAKLLTIASKNLQLSPTIAPPPHFIMTQSQLCSMWNLKMSINTPLHQHT